MILTLLAQVFLLSSERRDLLMRWLGDVQGLENVGLAAEDGYYYKWPGSPANRWDIRTVVNAAWKVHAAPPAICVGSSLCDVLCYGAAAVPGLTKRTCAGCV